jgi:hypothetical protein
VGLVKDDDGIVEENLLRFSMLRLNNVVVGGEHDIGSVQGLARGVVGADAAILCEIKMTLVFGDKPEGSPESCKEELKN